MRSVVKLILFFCAAVFFAGCGNAEQAEPVAVVRTLPKQEPERFETPEKLISFVDNKENGFIRTKTIKEITYSSILKPTDYLLAQQIVKEGNTALKKEDFEDLQYFDLRINVDGFNQEFIKYNLDSNGEYQERVNYCAFGMQEDIKLIDGKDTLNCVLYHYERSFDVVPYGHFTLGFETKKGKTISTKTLLFNDRLFNNGLIQFTYLPELLVKEPMLL